MSLSPALCHTSFYAGQRVAFLTQHGKERVIAPALEAGLGCTVNHVTGFDTDQLGTFTREVTRPGSQINAARRKARKGMELSGLSVGMASEGSFGPDPFTGLMDWNVELLVWMDDQLGIEVVGMAQGAARSSHMLASTWGEVKAFAVREGFPQHQLVMRPEGQDDPRLHKGVTAWDQLSACFDTCQSQAKNRKVFVEADLRAFANPSRMQHIALAADDLLRRIQSCCPVCQSPGYWVSQREPGLPCAVCAAPTTAYQSETWSCVSCHHKTGKTRTDRATADPSQCAYCNP